MWNGDGPCWLEGAFWPSPSAGRRGSSCPGVLARSSAPSLGTALLFRGPTGGLGRGGLGGALQESRRRSPGSFEVVRIELSAPGRCPAGFEGQVLETMAFQAVVFPALLGLASLSALGFSWWLSMRFPGRPGRHRTSPGVPVQRPVRLGPDSGLDGLLVIVGGSRQSRGQCGGVHGSSLCPSGCGGGPFPDGRALLSWRPLHVCWIPTRWHPS